MLQAWKKHVNELKTVFGLTTAQLDEVVAMADNYDYTLGYFSQYGGNQRAATKFKKALFRGLTEGQEEPTFPVFDVFTSPAAPVFDIEGLAKEYRNFFLKHLNYTDTFGGVLLIAEPESDGAAVLIQPPIIKAENLGSYKASIAFSKKGNAGIRIEWRLQGTIKFKFGTNGIGSPVVLEIPEADDDKPVTIEIQAAFIDSKNNVVSAFSQVEIVTLTS
jgi:hypothetical protein